MRPNRFWRAVLVAVLVGGLTALTATVSSPGRARASAARPNIVFVLTDDLSNNLVRYLPSVVKLADAGTSFSRYYVVDSLCCPSRSAIFTGEYPHNDGVYTNAGPDGGYNAFIRHGDPNKSFAVTLKAAGYRTALMGKFLNGYSVKDGAGPGWTDWALVDHGYGEFDYQMNVDGSLVSYGKAPEDYLTDVLSVRASRFIRSSVRAGTPFLLEVATFAPHRPEVPAPRYAKAYAGNLVPKTPAFDVLPTNPPSWMSKILPMDRADKEFVQQRWLARLRSVLAIDDLLASLRTELASLGIADNTYVIFSSDNGFHLGDHRLDYGKETAFDTDVNVPLVVAGPSVPAGRTDARMTSSIDLAPTFEQIAGADVPSTVDGTSMLPLWHGQSAPGWQKAILIEHRQSKNGSTDPDAQEIEPPSYEAVRTPGALYVEYSDGGTEYYDTATDPYELRNVADRAPAGMVRDLHQLKTCAGARRCQAAAGAR